MKSCKILFICHGNICCSPMAEFVMKDLVEKAGLSAQFEIASAATSMEEIGNPVYPPARQKLAEHGISCAGKTARQMTRRDYENYDYIIAMDHNNLRNMAGCSGRLHSPVGRTAKGEKQKMTIAQIMEKMIAFSEGNMSGNWKMPIMFRAFVREYLYCTDKCDNLRKQ